VSIRDTYLPILDKYRGKLNTTWDLRRFDVVVRVNTWSGVRAGKGTVTTTDTPLLCNGGRPKVEQVSSRDIIASAGRYQDQDLKVGPMTPPYTDANGNPAGTDITDFEPAVVGSSTEVLYKVNGPGIPPAGDWYTKISSETWENFSYYVVLRKTAAIHA